MCVLTYFPYQDNGFILTSNRDEAVSRKPAIPPKKYHIGGQQVFFPKDPKGGGTWIASSGDFTLCLLNGGFEKHVPQPPYKQSRGKVVLDFFTFLDVNNFIQQYDFEGIEPFTLVIIESTTDLTLTELRWNGTRLFCTSLDATLPRIWSSVTLYSPDIISAREQWFDEFKQQAIVPQKVIDFHHHGGSGDPKNDLKMNRNNTLKTISITQFVLNQLEFKMTYQDLQANNYLQYCIFKDSIGNSVLS